MWCLVNRKAGIVIFFYEDTVDQNGKKHSGGRRRAVLKEFLGDAKIKSLQSDGYNVYMSLDDEMVDIEHICCLAHVHNKLQEAKNSGIFNTFISTCKQKGRNFRDFLVDYVREYNKGNRDFVGLVRLAFSPVRN